MLIWKHENEPSDICRCCNGDKTEYDERFLICIECSNCYCNTCVYSNDDLSISKCDYCERLWCGICYPDLYNENAKCKYCDKKNAISSSFTSLSSSDEKKSLIKLAKCAKCNKFKSDYKKCEKCSKIYCKICNQEDYYNDCKRCSCYTEMSIDLLQSTLKDKILNAVEDLKTKGYAIIESIIDEKTRLELISMMWDTLESESNNKINREKKNYSDMKMSELFPHKHGIIESYKFNHSEFVRKIRTLDPILEIFSAIYGTTQLIGSLDRVNVKLPGKSYKSTKDWPHADQNPNKEGFRCIQSYLDLYGTETTNQPSNRFYENSHNHFESFTKEYKEEYSKTNKDWFKLTDEQIKKIPKECNKLVHALCPPGSLVLWDSRTIHSPYDGTDFINGRFVVYVCYLPYDEKLFTEKEEKKKQEAFKTLRATTHLPFPQQMFPKIARTYGNDDMKYLEFKTTSLFASRLKNETDTSISKYLEPNDKEKLLYGFKSYSNMKKSGIGLWGLKWNGAPLLKIKKDDCNNTKKRTRKMKETKTKKMKDTSIMTKIREVKKETLLSKKRV